MLRGEDRRQRLRERLQAAGCAEGSGQRIILTVRGSLALRQRFQAAAHLVQVPANQLALEALLDACERVEAEDPLLLATQALMRTPEPSAAPWPNFYPPVGG